MAKTLKLELVVDDKGSLKVKKFGDNIDKSTTKASKGMKSLALDTASVKKALGITSVALVAFGTTAAVGMGKAIKAASDLEETTGKFNVVFESNRKEAEKMAKVLVDSYAMSTKESKLYLSSIQDLLVPMGMASDEALKMSNEVVKLAADLGSFNNLPTATVMLDIQSALVGNFETMKKYGVVLNETVIKQAALDMGLWNGKGMVDANTKAWVAFKLILKGSAAAIGDQKRTMGSFANQMKQLKANIEDISAAIGVKLLPEVTEWVFQTNEMIKQNPTVIDQLGEFSKNLLVVGTSLIKAGGFSVKFFNAMVDISKAMGLASTGLISWKTAILDGVSTVKLFETDLGFLELQATKLRDEIEELDKRYEKTFGSAAKKRVLDNLQESTKALKDTEARIKDLTSTTEALSLAQDDSYLDFGKWSDGIKDASKDIIQLTDDEKALIKFEKDKLDERVLNWKKNHEDIYKVVQGLSKVVGNETILAIAEEKKLLEKKAADFKLIHEASYKVTKDLSNLTIIDQEKVNAAVIKGQKDMLLATGTFFDGFKIGMSDAQKQTTTWAEHGQKMADTISSGMSKAFSDSFFAIIKGDFKDIGDAWETLLNSMLKNFTDILGQMATEWALKQIFGSNGSGGLIGSLTGGLTGGSGSGGGLSGLIKSLLGGGSTSGAAASAAIAGNTAYSLEIGNAGIIGGGGWGAGASASASGSGFLSSGLASGLATAGFTAFAGWVMKGILEGFQAPGWSELPAVGFGKKGFTYPKAVGTTIHSDEFGFVAGAGNLGLAPEKENQITQMVVDYFDGVFNELNKIPGVDLAKTLPEAYFKSIQVDEKGLDVALQKLSDEVFEDIIDALLLSLHPEAGSTIEKQKRMTSLSNSGLFGLEAYEAGVVQHGSPIFKEFDQEVSNLSGALNLDFFKQLGGGNVLAGLLGYAKEWEALQQTVTNPVTGDTGLQNPTPGQVEPWQAASSGPAVSGLGEGTILSNYGLVGVPKGEISSAIGSWDTMSLGEKGAWADSIGKPLDQMAWDVNQLKAYGYSKGGLIDSLIAPADDGLASVQMGEGVVSKKGMAALDKINSGEAGFHIGSLVTINGTLVADEDVFNEFVDKIEDRLTQLSRWGR